MKISRRDFIHAGCAIAASAVMPISVQAGLIHRGGSSFSGGAMQINTTSIQNGGDFPFLNLMKSGSTWGLTSQVTPYVVEPSLLDANGWPTSIPVGTSIQTQFFAPLQSERPGNYVFKWSGNGTAFVNAGNTAIAYTITAASIAAQCVLTCSPGTGNNAFNVRVGQPIVISGISGVGWASIGASWTILAVDLINNKITIGFNSSGLGAPTLTSAKAINTLSTAVSTGLAGAGRYVLSTTNGGILSLFAGTTAINSSIDYPHDMIFCHEDDEAAVDAGQIFGVKFLQKYQAANFGVIRHLGWQAANTFQITNWNSRRPINLAYYGGTELRSSIYGGITSNSGNAYTCSFPSIHSSDGTVWTSGAPKDKDTVIVTFNASATASGLCSLDVGSTGSPINILNEFSNPLSVGTNSYPIGLNNVTVAQRQFSIACLVYDVALNAWIKIGGDIAQGGCGLENGAPYEIMLALCQRLGAHPYFVMCQFALDPMTNFVPSLASFIFSSWPSWMVPRFEGPNETWNASGGNQTNYANNKQLLVNGAQSLSGVITSGTYNVSAFTYPSTASGVGFADITLSTPGNVFIIGSHINPVSFGGITNLPSSGFYVTAINVVANPNVITVQFTPTGSYTSGGTVTPSTNDFSNWYGKVLSTIGQACATVYGINNLGSKYWVLAGVQTGQGSSQSAAASWAGPRLSSTSYVRANNPQSPYTATSASLWTSHIACTQYWQPTQYGTGTETTASATFAAVKLIGTIVNGVLTISSTQLGTVTTGLNVFGQNIALSAGVTVVSGAGSTWTLSDLTLNMTINSLYMGNDSTGVLESYADSSNGSGGANNLGLTNLNTYYQSWVAYGQTLTNNQGSRIGLTGYEGGYSPDYSSSGNTQLDVFRYATKFVASSPGNPTGLQGWYATNLTNFKSAGGVFPSEFIATGKFPTNNAWSVLENIYQSPDAPQWNAIISFH
jgi:hypothetical protein